MWNHGGATFALRLPGFPRVVNVLSPASSYVDGTRVGLRDPGFEDRAVSPGTQAV
jgi:hypothetical protein